MRRDALLERAQSLMKQNQRVSGEHQYTVPAPSAYPYQWFWDSCFHALILSHFDPHAAEAELLSLAAKQTPDGFMAHVIYWDKTHILDVPWHSTDTSDLIQPPLLAETVERVYAVTENKEFLERIYPTLVRYYDFLRTQRDIRSVGLMGYVNPDESGEDNSPRFDEALKLPPQHPVESNLERRYALFDTHRECNILAECTGSTFWVEDVPLNVFMIANLEALGRLAHELGEHYAGNEYERQAKAISAAMRSLMWNGRHFTPLTGLTGTQTKENTWSRFAPLLTRQYTKAEAKALIEKDLMDDEQFWLPFGVPTVTKNAAAYDPEEPEWGEAWQHPHWRGPTWMAVHWFLYHGLKNYGYDDLAGELKAKSYGLIAKEGFREYYHPESGVGMGAQDFTWGALAIDME